MKVRAAEENDIPVMLAIFERAFAEDDHTQLKIAWRGDAAMRDGMASALEGWRVSPVATLLVAEDASAEVVGWACWSTAGQDIPREAIAREVPTAIAPVDELERITIQDIERCRRDILMEYGAVDVLVSIAVDPAAQGRGAGGSLIGWGLQRADAIGRVCWVHASEVGARAFARHGFVVDRDLVIDLSRYAPPRATRSWGTARFCSMTRSPGAPADRSLSRE